MRFSTFLFACLAGLAKANFDLYLGHFIIPAGGGVLHEAWFIYPIDPNCNDVWNGGYYLDQDDVSGSKTGVRCSGSGCYGGAASDIDVVEMHFTNSPLYHWTIYKNRGHPYKMYGLDGNTYGECILFPGDDFHCSKGVETRSGVRKFRCLTQFTVAQIRAGN
ncbi:hypothetical protein B0T21DRAFT_416769 [Apiosordaria backusii]|uniref:Uncharacterized protein n=1 Tax=Apiosordaria backusii TaxID=314023 RepID=A0AA39ZSP1_9PEZI|nr:hypothetical protein B0T21DRAFT_416769 [Apiosordaria backusii]